MIQALLALLLALPAYYRDTESHAERSARMLVVARSIDAAVSRATCDGPFKDEDCKPVWAGSRDELAALLVAVGFYESGFALHVGEGRCGRHECDGQNARHYWQQWAGPWLTRAEWSTLDGTGYVPTSSAAYGASRMLSTGAKRCHSPEGAIGFYARPSTGCRWEGAAKRMPLYRRTLAALRAPTTTVEKPEVLPTTKPQD